MLKKIFMPRNVANWDRVLRTLPAILTLIGWSLGSISGGFAIGLAVISVMLLVTSATGTCSVYSVFGFSTLRKHQ